MKIAAVKKFTQVLVAMAVAAVMAALLCAPKALGTTIGEFSIEQIYVNVPELDVFVQATDAQGQLISPDLVRAAGVELYLGDEKIPTGNIGMANEPICYVLAVDNSVDETTLKEYRIALRRLISAKGAKDQIMLYTLAGDAACVLPATIDTRAAVNAVSALESQEENEPNLVQAATIICNEKILCGQIKTVVAERGMRRGKPVCGLIRKKHEIPRCKLAGFRLLHSVAGSR